MVERHPPPVRAGLLRAVLRLVEAGRISGGHRRRRRLRRGRGLLDERCSGIVINDIKEGITNDIQSKDGCRVASSIVARE